MNDTPAPASMGSGSQFGSVKSSNSGCCSGCIGSFSSTSESPLSSSPTRLATIHRIVSGRSLSQRKRYQQRIDGYHKQEGNTNRRYRRMGSATLKRRTPGGSIIRRHLIVATYCCRMRRVSAPGWSNRFRFLRIADYETWNIMNEHLISYAFRKALTRLARWSTRCKQSYGEI